MGLPRASLAREASGAVRPSSKPADLTDPRAPPSRSLAGTADADTPKIGPLAMKRPRVKGKSSAHSFALDEAILAPVEALPGAATERPLLLLLSPLELELELLDDERLLLCFLCWLRPSRFALCRLSLCFFSLRVSPCLLLRALLVVVALAFLGLLDDAETSMQPQVHDPTSIHFRSSSRYHGTALGVTRSQVSSPLSYLLPHPRDPFSVYIPCQVVVQMPCCILVLLGRQSWSRSMTSESDSPYEYPAASGTSLRRRFEAATASLPTTLHRVDATTHATADGATATSGTRRHLHHLHIRLHLLQSG